MTAFSMRFASMIPRTLSVCVNSDRIRGIKINCDVDSGSLVAIFALAHEHNPDPAMRPYKEPVSAELRETLILGAAAGMNRIYHYLETWRSLEKLSLIHI